MATNKLAVTLYDITSRLNPQAWSSNVWKVRLVLNYKRIPYKTVWVSYPDIKATMRSIGGKPTSTNPDGEPHYTLPAIVDASSDIPIVMTDSPAIIEYLEEKYPDRPIFPKQGKALEYAFQEAFRSSIGNLSTNLVIPGVWKILDDRGQVYFRDTRERWYGQGRKLEEWCPTEIQREAAFATLEKALDKIAKIIDYNGPGSDYVAGGTHPTHADIIITAYLAWLIAALPEDWENRIRHWSGGRWERLWSLMEEWRSVP